MFTILGFLIIFSKHSFAIEKIYNYAIVGFAGMLFLNVFFSHIIASIIYKKYSPGLVTSVLLNLPLTSTILYQFHQQKMMSTQELILTSICGGIIGLAFVFLFLRIGKVIDQKLNTNAQ